MGARGRCGRDRGRSGEIKRGSYGVLTALAHVDSERGAAAHACAVGGRDEAAGRDARREPVKALRRRGGRDVEGG